MRKFHISKEFRSYSLTKRWLKVLEELGGIHRIVRVSRSCCLSLLLHALLRQNFLLNVQRKRCEELGIHVGHRLRLLQRGRLLGPLADSLLP